MSAAPPPAALWPPDLARRLDHVCLAFEAAYQAAAWPERRPRLEHYLEAFPPEHRPLLLRELLALDLTYRRRAGEVPGPDDYRELLPTYRGTVAQVIAEQVAAATPAGRPAATARPPAPGIPPREGVMRVTLAVTAGPHQGREFSFVGHDTFVVGRSPRAHFRLPFKDRRVSRFHFLVEVNPPHCRLLDMGSRNGTARNGRKVQSADLRDGDQVRAGRTVFRVRVEGGDDPGLASTATFQPEGDSAAAVRPVSSAQPLAQPHRRPAASPITPASQESCLACAAPLAPPAAGPARQPAAAAFCPACWDKVGSRPQPVAGYLLVRELGRGGMGVVHLAVREADGAVLAVKTIKPAATPTPALVGRFLREAAILHELDHPHIVAFRAMGESDGLLYFAMDYVPGTSGSRLLRANGGPLPVGRAVGLVCQLLDALAYAHARHFVHRDVKPANLLVSAAGGRDLVRLSDFGLARAYQTSQLSGLTLAGETGGTVAFMPPEQLTDFREAKPAADQYSTGATLYNVLTDRYIFDLPPDKNERLLLVLQGEPVPIQARRPDVPAELAAVIHRTLAREPGQRFPNVEALRQALSNFAD